jgi:hypothetical protein
VSVELPQESASRTEAEDNPVPDNAADAEMRPNTSGDEEQADGVTATGGDGRSWTRITHEDALFGRLEDEYEMAAATTGGPGLVAVGKDGVRDAAAVWTSADGRRWERVPHDESVFGGDGYQAMHSVAVGGPGLVAVGREWGSREDSAAVSTSPDGQSWQRVPHNEEVFGGEFSQTREAVTAGASGLIAIGSDGGRDAAAVWTSTDGEAWECVAPDNLALGNGVLVAMVAGGPGYVALGRDHAGRYSSAAVWTSVEGRTWNRVPPTDPSHPRCRVTPVAPKRRIPVHVLSDRGWSAASCRGSRHRRQRRDELLGFGGCLDEPLAFSFLMGARGPLPVLSGLDLSTEVASGPSAAVDTRYAHCRDGLT